MEFRHRRLRAQRALFLPDIDSWRSGTSGSRTCWPGWTSPIWTVPSSTTPNLVTPRGRRASPHPRIADTIRRLPPALAAKVRFIHLNHTNPARFPDAAKRRAVERSGAGFAVLGERFCSRNRALMRLYRGDDRICDRYCRHAPRPAMARSSSTARQASRACAAPAASAPRSSMRSSPCRAGRRDRRTGRHRPRDDRRRRRRALPRSAIAATRTAAASRSTMSSVTAFPSDKTLKDGDIVNIDVTRDARRLARRHRPHVPGRRCRDQGAPPGRRDV